MNEVVHVIDTFFPVQVGEKVNQCRRNGEKTSFFIYESELEKEPEKFKLMRTIEECEHHFLCGIKEYADKEDDVLLSTDDNLTIIMKLLRMSKSIAKNTMRGMGNHIIYHPANEYIIERLGKYVDIYTFHAHKSCPETKMICMYAGHATTAQIFLGGNDVNRDNCIDAGCFLNYFVDEPGKYYFWHDPEISNRYARYIDIKVV
jgi:hypothetical protein